MDYQWLNLERRGVEQQQLVGKENVIVPNHLVKYTLREGGGSVIEPGMTAECIAYIYLADGQPIVTGNRIARYLYGRGRLITGLQLGLKGVRLNEKLRLVISPEYAYQKEKDVKLVPPKSKLIFDLQIVAMGRVHPDQMTDPELYYEAFHYLDLLEKFLRHKDYPKGLDAISSAYFYAKRIKKYRCPLPGKILLKWGNILFHRQQYEQTLALTYQIDKMNPEVLEDALRLEIKVLRALKRYEQLQSLISNTYNENAQNDLVRRICVDFYKETENWSRLKELKGYSFKKDKFVKDVRKDHSQKNKEFLSFLL